MKDEALKLVNEYRPSMNSDLLHLWAKDMQVALKAMLATLPAAQPEQEPVASNCTHEWIDDTKNKPQWRCVKCGENYRREQA